MIADGLTNALPQQKWESFLNQLGLKNIEHRRQNAPQNSYSWEDLQDTLEGSKSELWDATKYVSLERSKES